MFIAPHSSTGGLPQYLYTKITKLKGLYEISVIEYSDIAPIYRVQKDKIIDEVGGRNLFSFPQGTPDDQKNVMSIIDLVKPDIIHIEEIPETFLPTNTLDKIYSKNRKYTIIETTHDSAYDPNNKVYLPDVFVFVCEYHRKKFDMLGIPSYIAEYPIETHKRPNREESLQALGLDPSKKHVLNVGLFTPGKNQGEVFEIAKYLPDVMFHFVGNQAENFKHYWKPLMVDKPSNCIIHGERSDVDRFYSSMDLLLFTSKSELNPLVPREAISWGMPVIMYNLPIYENIFSKYDNVTYLTSSRDKNIENIKHILEGSKPVNKVNSKIRLVHLLTQPNDERELKSVESLSKLAEYGIDYKIHINQPCKQYPNVKPITNHRERKPGYLGAYYSFRRAFEEEFTDDLDFFMVCECDCVLDVKSEVFVDILNKVCDNIKRNDIDYFSFGAKGDGNIVWSPNLEELGDDMFLTNHMILAHCILFPQKSRSLIMRRYEDLSWDSPDLWLNYAFEGKRMALLHKHIASQYKGESLIDRGEHKHTTGDMLESLKGAYGKTKITTKDKRILEVRYNVNFINGPFLEVVGPKEELLPNENYKNIYGFFNFDDIYRTMVHNAEEGAEFVEIGAFAGKSTAFMAEEIKNSGKIIKFYAVDTWEGSAEHQKMLKDICGDKTLWELFNQNIEPLRDYVNPICSRSTEAATMFADASLDFVFIDGSHTYEDVRDDIKAWYPKVKEGGYIGGHDYDMRFNGIFTIKKAVDEYFGDNTTIIDSSWLHRKHYNSKNIHMYGKYKVKFKDKSNIVYQSDILPNHWSRANRKWFTEWEINVSTDKGTVFNHKYNANGKNVIISLESKSLGDTLAWIPYTEEFRKKHNANVVCSTFWNNLFKDKYSDIKFAKPGTTIPNIYAQYNIGVNTEYFDPNQYPEDYRLIPLQKVASNVLGIEYSEIKPKIKDIKQSIRKKRYVCISIHSTAQAKYWNYPNGWQIITDYIRSKGLEVLIISKEKDGYMGNHHPNNIIDKSGDYPIEDRIADLKGSDLFIGIGSGLSWLSWSLNIPTILISGFSKPYCEPKSLIRIHNKNVCNGCFNDPNIIFDKGTWNWCPRGKDFECTKEIHPDVVIDKIDEIL